MLTNSTPDHNHAIVTVLGEDRCGIVAAISAVLSEAQANIIDIRQTILSQIFSMTMIVELNEDCTDFDTLQERLNEAAAKLGVQATLQRESVFRFMHRLDV